MILFSLFLFSLFVDLYGLLFGLYALLKEYEGNSPFTAYVK